MRSAGKMQPTGRAIPVRRSALSGGHSALWIAWNEHRRTTGLCSAWDVPLHVMRSKRKGLLRWMVQAFRTLRLLRREKPAILFVQNPSLASTVLAFLTRRLFGYFLVVDAHNEGVRPFARPGKLIRWLTRRLLHGADATIVTNTALAEDVCAAGGHALVLPDRLPEPELPANVPARKGAPVVAVISSFMADEPVAAIVAAAGTLPELRFEFTGDARRSRHGDMELPTNVRLTGYLTEKSFWKLLSQADVICDLTLKPDCLVCGAYEALALAKPMVLSDNPPTREIFGSAAVLTNGESESIASAVRVAIEQRSRLAANARVLRDEYPPPWQDQAAAAWEDISARATAARRGLA